MKTTKLLVMAFAISAIVACSKSDDLQLIEAQSVEIENLDATNLKTISAVPKCNTWSFYARIDLGAGSLVYPPSKVEAIIDFETSEGNKSVTLLLSNNAHGDPNYRGEYRFTPKGCWDLSPLHAGWIKLKKATITLRGTGVWKIEYLDIHMVPPVGSSNITGHTGIYPNNYAILTNSNSSGVSSYSTAPEDVGAGIIRIQDLAFSQN